MENNNIPNPVIKKTASNFEIQHSENLKPNLKVGIDLISKKFSIENSIEQSSGIKIEIGDCKDINLLKSVIESYQKAIEIIETEFAAIVETPVEETKQP